LLTLSIQSIINQHLIRALLKGVTQITVIFIFGRLIDVLILYVFPNLGFIQADCAYIISTCPKTMTFKIPFQSAVFLENSYLKLQNALKQGTEVKTVLLPQGNLVPNPIIKKRLYGGANAFADI